MEFRSTPKQGQLHGLAYRPFVEESVKIVNVFNIQGFQR